MSDQFRPSVPAEPQQEPAGKPVFAPYDAPAGGWGALHATSLPKTYIKQPSKNI